MKIFTADALAYYQSDDLPFERPVGEQKRTTNARVKPIVARRIFKGLFADQVPSYESEDLGIDPHARVSKSHVGDKGWQTLPQGPDLCGAEPSALSYVPDLVFAWTAEGVNRVRDVASALKDRMRTDPDAQPVGLFSQIVSVTREILTAPLAERREVATEALAVSGLIWNPHLPVSTVHESTEL